MFLRRVEKGGDICPVSSVIVAVLPSTEGLEKERTQDRITSLSVQLNIRFVNCVVHLNGRTLRSRETSCSANSNEFLFENFHREMSVGVGMGIGRGHVTLGHGVNLTGSNATPGSGVDGLDGGSEHDQISPTWSVQCWDTLGDQVDHLILLPERALTMDSGWLQADLAEILAHSVIGHGRGDGSSSGRDYSVTPFLSHPHERSSSSHDGSDSWFPHSRRRSLDWSLVNSSAGQPQSPFVAIATSADRKLYSFFLFHLLLLGSVSCMGCRAGPCERLPTTKGREA